MPYRKKKTGTKRESRTRYTGPGGAPEVYYVDVDVFENVYVAPESYDHSSSDNSSTDYGSSYGGE